MNKLVLLPLLGALVLSLGACQLAQEDAVIVEDTLIGGFVTARTEEEFLEIGMPEGADENGRLYAQDETFPGLEGVFFTYEVTYDSETNAYYTRSGSNQGFWNGGVAVGSVGYNTEKEQGTVVMKGMVYYGEQREITTFTLYPVYQTGDGKVYADLGNGVSVSGDGEGIIPSAFYAVKNEGEVNGKKTSRETSLRVEIGTKTAAQTVTLVQLDEAHRVLAQENFMPGQCPDQLAPRPKTAYFLVEYRDSAGEVTERELVQHGEDYLYTAWQMDSGFFAAQPTQLVWKE